MLRVMIIRYTQFQIGIEHIRLRVEGTHKRNKTSMRTHLIQVTPELEVIYDVGQSAQENHDMVDAAAPTDLWFHVTGRPSCHVIAHVPEEVLNMPSKARRAALRKITTQGAVLCKRFSKYVSEKRLSMDVARVSDVEKSSVPGSVVLAKAGEAQTVTI